MAFHIKTFRALIGAGGQHTLSLHTNNGRIGYRIVNFLIFPNGASTGFDYESFVSIWKKIQSSVPTDGSPDFSDSTLLACSLFSSEANTHTNPEDLSVFFDREIFNQDIYITHSDAGKGKAINYYIELEQFILNENENTVATLKDIKANAPKQ